MGMKFVLFSALLWALAKSGASIWCRQCKNPFDPSCSHPVSQRCDHMCMTASIQEYSVGFDSLQIYKGCGDRKSCMSVGTQNFSVNLGGYQVTASIKCCDTDECNTETLPAPPLGPINHQQCSGCHPSTSKCSCVVHCKGDQTVCFNTTVGKSIIGGCASPGLCENAQRLNKLPFFKYIGGGLRAPTCQQATTRVIPDPLSLHCETCVDPNDPLCKEVETTTCPRGSKCLTSTTKDTFPGKPPIRIFKGCVPSSKCPVAGSKTLSLNLGFFDLRTTLKCCNKDKCNSQTVPAPVGGPIQKLRCHICVPGTKNCNAIIPCQGLEDRCFHAKVTTPAGTSPILGCTTANLCEYAKKHHKLPYTKDYGNISHAYCCDTNFCNAHKQKTTTTTTTTTTPVNTTTTPMTTPTTPMTTPTTTTTTPTTTTTTPMTTTTTPTTTTTTPTTTTTTPTTTTTMPTTTTTMPTTTTTTTTTVTTPTTTTTMPTTTTTMPTTTTTMPTTKTTTPTTTTSTSTSHGGLKCYKCKDPSDPSCKNIVPYYCPHGTMCVTASIADTSPVYPNRFYKGCAPVHKCPARGFKFYSINFGTSQEIIFVKCCDTNLCNGHKLPVLIPQAPNKLQCHVCSPKNKDCSSITQCRGNENKCFSAKITTKSGTSPLHGCMTANVCKFAKKYHKLPYMRKDHGNISHIDCCDTDWCNGHKPETTTTTVTTPTTTTTTPTTTTTMPTTTTTMPTTTTTMPTTTTTMPTTTPTTPMTTTTTSTTTTTTPTTTTTMPTTTTTMPTTKTTTPTTTTSTSTNHGGLKSTVPPMTTTTTPTTTTTTATTTTIPPPTHDILQTSTTTTASTTTTPSPPYTSPTLPSCPVLTCPTKLCPSRPAPPPKRLLRELKSLINRLQQLLRRLQDLLRRLQTFLQKLLDKLKTLRSMVNTLRNMVRRLQNFVRRIQQQLNRIEGIVRKLEKPGRQCRC